MLYSVYIFKIYFPQPPGDITIVMISPHPNHLLPVGDLLKKVQDFLVGRGQFHIDIIDNLPIQYKFTILGNACEKPLKNLI